jgi:hypothetical protein
MARCDMLVEQIPENAIFIKVGYVEVSAFGQLAICTVFLLAVAVLIFRRLRRF